MISGRIEPPETRVVRAAREYRRRIKLHAPSIQITVANPEQLEPIKEAARELDAALHEAFPFG